MRRIFSEIALVSLPKVVGGVLMLVLNVVLLRELGAEVFGIFSVCLTLILLADAILGSPFDTCVIRIAQPLLQSQPDRAASTEREALLLKLIVVLVMGVLASVFAPTLSERLFDDRQWHLLIPIVAFAILCMSMLRSALVHLQIRHRFAEYAISDALHLLAKFAGVGGTLLINKPAVVTVLLWFAAGPLVGLIYRAADIMRRLRSGRSASSPERRYFARTLGWYAGTVALGALIGRMDVVFLAWLSASESVGVYSAGFVLASIPEMLGSYLAVVLTPRILPMGRTREFRRFFIHVQLLLGLLAVCGVAVCFGVIHVIDRVLLPEEYEGASGVFMILLVGTAAAFVTVPLALGVVLLRDERFVLAMDLPLFPLICVAYAWVIPIHGVTGAAAITCTSVALRSVIVLIRAWQLSQPVAQSHERAAS